MSWINWKRYLLATAAVFVFLFFFEFLIHGILLMDTYGETPSVWRSMSEMEANFPFTILLQLLLAAWLTYMFSQIYEGGGISNGLRFGLYFGVFAGLLSGSWYLVLPISAKLGWSWFATSIAEGLGAGALLGSIYRKRNNGSPFQG